MLIGRTLLYTTYTGVFQPPEAQRVLPSLHVSSTSGTGVVHMAPAHGAEDYAVFTAAGLLGTSGSDIVSPVDGNGRYSEEILKLCRDPGHGLRLVGKEVLSDGTQEILSILKEVGALVACDKYKHRYPYDLRTNRPMIVR